MSIEFLQNIYLGVVMIILFSLITTMGARWFKLSQIRFRHFLVAYIFSIGVSYPTSIWLINKDFFSLNESPAFYLYGILSLSLFTFLFYRTLKFFFKDIVFHQIVKVLIVSGSLVSLVFFTFYLFILTSI